MFLYLIKQEVNDDFDTYSAAVVSANDAEDAKTIHPDGTGPFPKEHVHPKWDSEWAYKLEDITVTLIGTTDHPRGVILASYHPF